MHARKGIIIVALIGIVLASLGVGAYAVTSSYRGNYWSAVYSKSYGFGSTISLTSSWRTILSITLPSLPSGLYYHVVCDGYAAIGDSQIQIAIGVDSTTEDTSTRRFYGSLDTTILTGLHTERLYQLGAGSHTFYFLGRKYSSYGYANTNYHTITVTVYTDGGLTSPTYSSTFDVNPDGIQK